MKDKWANYTFEQKSEILVSMMLLIGGQSFYVSPLFWSNKWNQLPSLLQKQITFMDSEGTQPISSLFGN